MTRNDVLDRSQSEEVTVEIIHLKSDPAMWIVRRRNSSLSWKISTTTDWFYEEMQARTFAAELRRNIEVR